MLKPVWNFPVFFSLILIGISEEMIIPSIAKVPLWKIGYQLKDVSILERQGRVHRVQIEVN
jgi:hypothetical protein